MTQKRDSDKYQVIWLVRRLFRALAQKANEYLEQYGLSAADRAVLEFLYPDAKLSVPEIAQRYQVSRQHVQVTVNNLLELKLIVTRDNPRHKRSPLIVLNKKGRDLFDKILKQDAAAIDDLFAGINKSDIRVTRQTLETLYKQLS